MLSELDIPKIPHRVFFLIAGVMSRENISDSFVGEIYECENSSAETRVYQIAGTKNIINLEEEMLLKF